MAIDKASLREIVGEYGERWYHVTDASRLDGILARGLVPGMPGHWSPGLVREGAVYLASYREIYGVLTEDCDVDWGDAIVGVDLASLDPSRVVADEDALRPADSKSTAASVIRANPRLDTPAEILRLALDRGTLAYMGLIPASALRLEYVPAGRTDVPWAAALRRRLMRSAYWGQGEFANPDFDAEFHMAR